MEKCGIMWGSVNKCGYKGVVVGVQGLCWAKGLLHSMPGGQGNGLRAAKLFGQRH